MLLRMSALLLLALAQTALAQEPYRAAADSLRSEISKQGKALTELRGDSKKTIEEKMAGYRDQRIIVTRHNVDAASILRALAAESDRIKKNLDEIAAKIKDMTDSDDSLPKTEQDTIQHISEINQEIEDNAKSRKEASDTIRDILSPIGKRYEDYQTLRRRTNDARFPRSEALRSFEEQLKNFIESVPAEKRDEFKNAANQLETATSKQETLRFRRDSLNKLLSLFKDTAKTESLNKNNKETTEFINKTILDIEYLIRDIDDVIVNTASSIQNKDYYNTLTTALFGVAITFVIGAFFMIAYRSSSVQEAIFKNDSGLQFVTLFSLIIAIILFGVLKILEGKELSALLGGLSGYILGRGSISSAGRSQAPEQSPNPAPRPNPAPTPQPTPTPPAPAPVGP